MRTPQSLPGNPTSVWLATTPATDFPSLTPGVSVDVAIIGGGLVGLTAATLLKAEGLTVAVVEAGRIVQGVTGYTTAKLTAQHGQFYDYLLRHFGEPKARAYAVANLRAIDEVSRLALEHGIDCDFQRTESYVYTESSDEVDTLRAEGEAAARLGLPSSLVTETPLPFPVRLAVRFDNQAEFHPRKYLLGLARLIPGGGSHIFEQTRVTGWDEGEPCTVHTERGEIRAGKVVVASHFPVNDKALYATRVHQSRSYVLGVRIDGPAPRGMFVSTEPEFTVRSYTDERGELLILGGEGHRTGEGGDTVERYFRLEQWARQHFPVRSVDYRWSTQDNVTLDRVPYVGRITPASRHAYVATGFRGWGMTNSTASAMLIRDLIVGRPNPAEDVYDPNRLNLESLSEFAKHGADIATHLVGDRFSSEDPSEVQPGEGRVVKTGDGHVAMFRAEDGSVRTLSAACSHMGCIVQWNSAERSWDCPCHGSRFALDGSVLHGPAIKPLEPKG